MKMAKKSNPTTPHLSHKASSFAKATEDRSDGTARLRRARAFIILLLVALSFNAYSMKRSKETGWVEYIGNTLLYGTEKFKAFLSYIHAGPLSFTELPPEIQYTIINLLAINSTAISLEEAAQTIRALSLVNHQLNDLINEPKYCLKIIKHLAQQFNCSDQQFDGSDLAQQCQFDGSDETAAEALKTNEAKNRLIIQKQFLKLFQKAEFDIKEFNDLYTKHKDYIDLDFTYSGVLMFARGTLLIQSLFPVTHSNSNKINCLLNTNAVDVNLGNKEGMTILMLSAFHSSDSKTVELLCNYPTINLNQKNIYGETALMFLCKRCNSPLFKLANLKIILDAGADPEIADFDGLTPLQAAQNTGKQQIIDLIQDAIDKKDKS